MVGKNFTSFVSSRFDILSEITRDIAQVFFASLFIGPIISGYVNWLLLIFGLLLSLIFWSFSFLLSK